MEPYLTDVYTGGIGEEIRLGPARHVPMRRWRGFSSASTRKRSTREATLSSASAGRPSSAGGGEDGGGGGTAAEEEEELIVRR
jgi:hypothetical protein